ncbi:MAG: DNA-binding response regulator [Actinobacteria bacterium 13_2_20CM_2_72_6]|nr:MAG: DNA-binding response regulator [Actinobacteria bacterium 13_2_20CM_2_72_6]
MRLLVVEDEPKMAGLLRRALVEEGYAVDVADTGDRGYQYAVAVGYDAIVLDVLLPGPSGFEVCDRLRRRAVWTPVLMLTARDAVTDRIRGLDGGADDYLTKPFSLAELLARLRALARRGAVARPTVLSAGDLRLDPASRQVWRGEVDISLTAKEFALLEAFLRHPGAVLTREALLRRCWDFAYAAGSNVVDVHIRSLRDKIDRPFRVTSVETVRGTGYRLRRDGGR